jgi:hypothetical protein
MCSLSITLLISRPFFRQGGRHGGKIVGGEEAEPYSIPYQVTGYLHNPTCSSENRVVRHEMCCTTQHKNQG